MEDPRSEINEVELEPIPSEEDIAGITAQTGRGRERNLKERQEEYAILKNVLSDLRLNTLTNRMEYGPRSSPVVLAGDDIETLTIQLAMEHKVYIPEARIKALVRYAAKKNQYCPIKRYLLECSFSAKPYEDWDRIGEILLGSKEPIATLGLQKYLVGAVARAYNPGCCMSWVPIIIGKQGCGKSQLVRELVPKDLFAEITTGLDLLQKEIFRLHVAWLIELPEIDGYFQPKNIETFKNLITVQCDETRRPYASLTERIPRKLVMVGTSNRSEIFVDPTGNRRYLPMEIPEGFETPWRSLHTFRDQIWARAIKEYEKGVEWNLTAGDVTKLSEYIKQFNIIDPWEQCVEDYLKNREECTTTDVLLGALDFTQQSMGRREALRVGSIMTQMGWRRQITKRDGKSVRLWKRPKKSIHSGKKTLSEF